MILSGNRSCTYQQRHALDAVVASVDVVTHEEVVCVRTTTADLKQLCQIVELPVDVPTDCNRAAHGDNIAHLDEHLTRFEA